MRRTFAAALLLLMWTCAARATVGDRCELNSECDSGEQCRLRVCAPWKPAPVPDEATQPGRRLSTSSVCMTPLIACPVNTPQPSGTICTCKTRNGPVGGVIP